MLMSSILHIFMLSAIVAAMKEWMFTYLDVCWSALWTSSLQHCIWLSGLRWRPRVMLFVPLGSPKRGEVWQIMTTLQGGVRASKGHPSPCGVTVRSSTKRWTTTHHLAAPLMLICTAGHVHSDKISYKYFALRGGLMQMQTWQVGMRKQWSIWSIG